MPKKINLRSFPRRPLLEGVEAPTYTMGDTVHLFMYPHTRFVVKDVLKVLLVEGVESNHEFLVVEDAVLAIEVDEDEDE